MGLLRLLLACAFMLSEVEAFGANDRFGVKQLYPTAPGGKEWTSSWDNGVPRTFSAVDPQDPWFDAGHGAATFKVDGNGLFKITGMTPRMYVHDPAKQRSWRDVEMTVYGMRVSDDGTPYAGLVGVTRSNHGTTGSESGNPCDTRGYGARLRYDGTADFDKETSHPNATAAAAVPVFPGGMPRNTWLGFKHVTYDLPNGNVVNELWIDRTGGVGGGTWEKLTSLVDDGKSFGKGAVACRSGIDPALRLSNSDARTGSESGKPSITVYWRSTNVGTDGLVYKSMSVREINASGSGPAAGGGPPAPPPVEDSEVKAPQKFLSPALADGINDAAVFGPGAREVTIHDAAGAQVYSAKRAAGSPPLKWDCRDGSGSIVPSGVYIAKIETTDDRRVYQSFAVVK